MRISRVDSAPPTALGTLNRPSPSTVLSRYRMATRALFRFESWPLSFSRSSSSTATNGTTRRRNWSLGCSSTSNQSVLSNCHARSIRTLVSSTAIVATSSHHRTKSSKLLTIAADDSVNSVMALSMRLDTC